MPSSATT
jgi:hypothetical protein